MPSPVSALGVATPLSLRANRLKSVPMKVTVKNICGFIIVALIVLTTASSLIAQVADDSIVVRDSAQALEMALAYTGFEEYPDFELKDALGRVEEVTFRDSTMPFLADSLDGLPAWEVEFQSVILHRATSSLGLDKKHPKQVTVSLDQNTGKLLRIIVLEMGLSRDSLYPKADSKTAESKLQGCSLQRFHGLPSERPIVSFARALNDVTGGSPALSKEIVAYYVLESRLEKEPWQVWDIHLYNIPPRPDNPEFRTSIRSRDHFRSVVDAKIGKLLWANNVP